VLSGMNILWETQMFAPRFGKNVHIFFLLFCISVYKCILLVTDFSQDHVDIKIWVSEKDTRHDLNQRPLFNPCCVEPNFICELNAIGRSY